jgi:D-alanyl-lipoteichoic acid acyltransferase DltB (MBOAT superfamily)
MLFTELIFAPFLFFTFLFFYIAKRWPKAQIIILLIASYFFYAWWNAKLVWLILFSSLVDYTLGELIDKATRKNVKRGLLCASIAVNLGLLAYFKYANFFIDNIRFILEAMGYQPNLPVLSIVLPIGISFYTFQTMSYTFDIYLGILKPSKSLLKYLLYVAAFPQLVAGPIVRARELLPQLEGNLAERSNDIGLFRILYGLIKKLLIADTLGAYFVDPVFSHPENYSSLELLLGVYAFSFQIFFDFSAYSDIAIGLGKLFGMNIPENFKVPYVAKNPTDFWKRWHITFVNWLRDYLYMPLVFSLPEEKRTSRFFAFRNLMIVMFLAGLWHGANWTFVLWGILHGLYFILYYYLTATKNKFYHNMPDGMKAVVFFHLVVLSNIFWRAADVQAAGYYIVRMCSFQFGFSHFFSGLTLVMIAACVGFHFGLEPRLKSLSERFQRWHWMARAACFYALFVVMGYIAEQGLAHKAFIYFQF